MCEHRLGHQFHYLYKGLQKLFLRYGGSRKIVLEREGLGSAPIHGGWAQPPHFHFIYHDLVSAQALPLVHGLFANENGIYMRRLRRA